MPIRTSENGLFGIKAHFEHVDNCIADLSPMVDSWIYICRKNHLKQAISTFKARLSGIWAKPAFGENLTPIKRHLSREDYDFEEIERFAYGGERADHKWRTFFEEQRITPFVIYYEDFATDYAATMEATLSYLGLPSVQMKAPLQKQYDELSQYYYERFLEDAKMRGDEIPPEWLVG